MSSKRIAVAVAAFSLLSVAAGQALAAGHEACREYATEAVRQVHLMHEHAACNRGRGPRWSDNWRLHYEWCLGASWEAVVSERDARTNWLRACGH
jgi:hypothetical protein